MEGFSYFAPYPFDRFMHCPFRYHGQVAAYFKTHDKLWRSFSAAAAQQFDYDQFKTQLLKDTYRLEPEAEPVLYAAINKAKEVLGITHKVTVYQLMQSAELNAFVYTLPDEAHIVCSGNLLKLMDEQELLAVMSHELGHLKLFAADNGDYLIADRILNALATGIDANASYMETARRYDLYTELYCDQMALMVVKDPLPVISSLVKLNTGLDKVSAESYIRQATEIFKAGDVKSEQITHPENFIRAYALHLAQTDANTFEQKIVPVIEGQFQLHQLDVFSKVKLQEYSRQLINTFFADKTVHTETLINLARQYFPDFQVSEHNTAPDASLLTQCDTNSRNYFAYFLLDFAQADKDVESEAFSNAFKIAAALGLKEVLKDLIKKELKLSEKKFTDRYKKTLAVYA